MARRDSAGLANSDQDERFEDNVGDQKVIIYPNPTKGQLKIDLQGGNEIISTLDVFNLAGSLLLHKTPASGSMMLDLSNYPSGTYILKIVVGNKASEWKIIKE